MEQMPSPSGWSSRTRNAGTALHRITNQAMTPNGDGVAARSYVDAIVLAGDNRSGVRAVGFYDDDLVDTDDGWKIARRRFTMVLLETGLAGTRWSHEVACRTAHIGR